MAREGIQRATTRAICSEAGVHQSLFHYSFSSKRELFEELVRKAMTDLGSETIDLGRVELDPHASPVTRFMRNRRAVACDWSPTAVMP